MCADLKVRVCNYTKETLFSEEKNLLTCKFINFTFWEKNF